MEGMDWINVAQDRNKWWVIVDGSDEHSDSIKCGEFVE